MNYLSEEMVRTGGLADLPIPDGMIRVSWNLRVIKGKIGSTNLVEDLVILPATLTLSEVYQVLDVEYGGIGGIIQVLAKIQIEEGEKGESERKAPKFIGQIKKESEEKKEGRRSYDV